MASIHIFRLLYSFNYALLALPATDSLVSRYPCCSVSIFRRPTVALALFSRGHWAGFIPEYINPRDPVGQRNAWEKACSISVRDAQKISKTTLVSPGSFSSCIAMYYNDKTNTQRCCLCWVHRHNTQTKVFYLIRLVSDLSWAWCSAKLSWVQFNYVSQCEDKPHFV